MKPAIISIQHRSKRDVARRPRVDFFICGLTHAATDSPATVGMVVTLLLHVWCFAIDILYGITPIEHAIIYQAAIPTAAAPLFEGLGPGPSTQSR